MAGGATTYGQPTPAGRVTNPPVLAPYLAADFPVAEFEARLATVRATMRERQLAALLVVNPENIYYLVGLNHQGYFSYTLLVVPFDGDPIIVARTMERPTLDAQVPQCAQVLYADDEDPAAATVAAIRQCTAAGDTIGMGYDTMFFPPAIWQRVHARLGDRAWLDSDVVEQSRAIKSPAEIGLTRKAAHISDRAVQAGIEAVQEGATERAVAAAVYHELILAGSEHPGFAPFVRSSDILQHEHVTWRDRELDRDSVLLMELSGCVYRYHAPLTRMVHIGEPPAAARAAAEAAFAGMAAIEGTLRPGVRAGDVYAAWQSAVNTELGHDRYVRHHCGYTVGIGFPPSWVGGSGVVGIRRGSDLELREGMVFHVLSWILGQLPVDFCVSDTIIVTASGCEVLTTTERFPTKVAN